MEPAARWRCLWLFLGFFLFLLLVGFGQVVVRTDTLARADAQFRSTDGPLLVIDCSRVGVCGSVESESYAYAAADIRHLNVRHLYFCSGGVTNVSFDSIRYINDRERHLKIVLSVADGAETGRDMAACDPSIVTFGGHVYMAYGSAFAMNRASRPRADWQYANAIHLARAGSFETDFHVLDEDGNWKNRSAAPRAIAKPLVVSPERSHRTGYLGASWPSLVVHGGRIHLWYYDDTGRTGASTERRHRYFHSESKDGVIWSDPHATTISQPVHSADIKYDPIGQRYLMVAIFNPHESGSWLGVSSSADGLNWSRVERVGTLPEFSHNVGLQSDERGHLLPGAIEFTYGAPIGLVSGRSQGRWSLFGGSLLRR